MCLALYKGSQPFVRAGKKGVFELELSRPENILTRHTKRLKYTTSYIMPLDKIKIIRPV